METINEATLHLTRQLDLLPVDKLDKRIMIIGAGAIGGWVTLSLAKMGFTKLTVFDFDKVEAENLNSQFYRFSDVGRPKAAALQDLVGDFTNATIHTINDRYVGGPANPDILITAVDSMETRELAYESVSDETGLVIDPRMGAETAVLYTYKPSVQKELDTYAKTLHSDSDGVQERCTAKATIYTANLLAGLVCQTVKAHVMGQKTAKSIQWDIPSNQIVTHHRSQA